MEEFNKQLWDVIDDNSTFAEKSKAKSSFREFRKIAGIEGKSFRSLSGLYQFAIISSLLVLPLAALTIWLLADRQETVEWQEMSTRMGQTAQLVLADNTRVTLNGGSTIVYPSSFSGDIRQVYFSGEGYFEVQSDVEHPFDVITNDARIKVHGTKFNLKSYSDDKVIMLALDEGSVHFEGNSDMAEDVSAEMVPGDNISFDRETGILKKDYSTDKSGLWRKGQYYFKNESLGDIARDIERIYGIRVLIERDEILDVHYHIALVNGETPDDFIRILSLDESLKVSRKDNTIIIH